MPLSDSGNVERTVPSVSRRSGVVKTSSVGTFTMCGIPSTVSSAPVSQRCPSGRPTRRSVPGPTKRTATKLRSSSVAARRRSRAMCSRQAATGSGSSSRRSGGDCVPQALDVRLAEHGACPPLVRVAEDRPLDQPPVLRVEELLDCRSRPRPLRAALVEVGEQLGVGVPRDRDGRPARLDHVVDEGDRPRRAPVERVVRSVLDPRALQVVVSVEHLDVPGPALVGNAADRADQREVLRIGRDPKELPGLEVDSDLDGQACVPVEPLRRAHQMQTLFTIEESVDRRIAGIDSVVASARCRSQRSRASERRCC